MLGVNESGSRCFSNGFIKKITTEGSECCSVVFMIFLIQDKRYFKGHCHSWITENQARSCICIYDTSTPRLAERLICCRQTFPACYFNPREYKNRNIIQGLATSRTGHSQAELWILYTYRYLLCISVVTTSPWGPLCHPLPQPDSIPTQKSGSII